MIKQFSKQSGSKSEDRMLRGKMSLAVILAILIFGCTDNQIMDSEPALSDVSTEVSSFGDAVLSQADKSLLKSVKKATARFNSAKQAEQYGYDADDHCVAVEGLGGMGYHWVNEGLVDDEFNPLQPEAVLYERDKNGNLKLIAIEYIVINTGQDHPHFGDHPFDVNGTPVPVPHWSLHVWLYKDNPNGFFTPFNPNVSCG